ncbi:MAG: glycosyltransferase family 39 protein [Acidobacteriota bacterium]
MVSRSANSATNASRARLVVFGLALAARVLTFLIAAPWDPAVEHELVLHNDGMTYNQLAVSLIDDRRFATGPEDPPDPWHSPLYPVFVAGVYLVCGYRPWTVLLVQALLDSLTAVIVYSTVRRFVKAPRAALFAGVCYAFDPIAILHSMQMLTDILYVAVMVGGGYLFASALDGTNERGTHARFAAAGVVLGAAALVRPVGLYLPVAMIPLMLWLHRRTLRSALAPAALFLLCFYSTTATWQLRNWSLYRAYSLAAMGAWDTITIYTDPVYTAIHNVTDREAQMSLAAEADREMSRDGIDPAHAHAFAKAPYWERVALRLALDEPFLFAKFYLRGTVYFFANMSSGRWANLIMHRQRSHAPPPDGVVDRTPHNGMWQSPWVKTRIELLVAAGIGTWFLLTYSFALYGLWRSLRSGLTPFLAMCATIVLYYVLISGTGGMSRFKLPSIPFYSAFAGVGAASAAIRWSSRPDDRERL